jgi:hypothetical protein
MTSVDAIAERYREHWGFLDETPVPAIRRRRNRPVRCMDYPELPAFVSVQHAAAWAGVSPGTIVVAINRGILAAGVRFAYADQL